MGIRKSSVARMAKWVLAMASSLSTAARTGDALTPGEFARIRNAAGLSQERLARLLGLSSGRTIRRYEADRAVPPPVERLMRLIDAGHRSLIEAAGGD